MALPFQHYHGSSYLLVTLLIFYSIASRILGIFSLEALASGLSATARLKTLSLHFDSATYHSTSRSTPPPSPKRNVVSTLMHLSLSGPCGCLEDLLSRISAPCLKHANIAFLDQPSFGFLQLSQFLGHVGSQRPPNGARACLHLPGTLLYQTHSRERWGKSTDYVRVAQFGSHCPITFRDVPNEPDLPTNVHLPFRRANSLNPNVCPATGE